MTMPLTATSAAVERDDTAVNEAPPHTAAVLRRNLVDLAALLARVEALVAADAVPVPVGSDAIERITDIAFVLHERDVEASLCDALDAAVREIGAATALKPERAQRARQAVEMLRELSRRINDLIAYSDASHHGEPAGAVVLAGGSLPPPAANAEAVTDLRRNADAAAALPSGHDQQTAQAVRQGAAATGAGGAAKPRASAAAVLSVEPPGDLLLDEDLLLPTPPSKAAISPKSALSERSSGEASCSSEVPPSREATIAAGAPVDTRDQSSPREESSRPLDPDDDPDDLFEPAANMPHTGSLERAVDTAAAAPAPAHGSRTVPQQAGVAAAADSPQVTLQPRENAQPAMTAAAAENSSILSRVSNSDRLDPRLADTPVSLSASRPTAPSDPLSPLRTLSEEEMIALFS